MKCAANKETNYKLLNTLDMKHLHNKLTQIKAFFILRVSGYICWHTNQTKIESGVIMFFPYWMNKKGNEYVIRHTYKCDKCDKEIHYTETIIDESCRMTHEDIMQYCH